MPIPKVIDFSFRIAHLDLLSPYPFEQLRIGSSHVSMKADQVQGVNFGW